MSEKIVEGVIKNKELQKNLTNFIQDETLNKLEDIDGIDFVNFFPLAPGWWVIIIIASLIIIKALISFFWWRAFNRSYKGEVYWELVSMQKNLNNITSRGIAIKLSEIIRRLVMYQNSRLECASLKGVEWLKWLREHDKNKFDWEENGRILIGSIYAPPGRENISVKELRKLIEATKKWVF